MSLTDSNGGLSAADVAAVMGNNGVGNSFFGGDGAWWIIILFLFAFAGGWNGNGGFGGNGGGVMPYLMNNGTNGDIQRGFDQQAIMGGLNGLTASVSNGFANAEISRCNAQTNMLGVLANNQAATMQGMNTLASSLQQCCCDNRAGLADLKYTVATENCADRTALSDGLKDVIANQNAGIQAILDKMCQQELDALKAQNAQLNTQLQMANLAASQSAQTGQLLADNSAQTANLLARLNPAPIPAYVVQNPNGGCNCGMYSMCGTNV